MSITGNFLVAGTKFGPIFSSQFFSSINCVLVKLMTACFIYDIGFCLIAPWAFFQFFKFFDKVVLLFWEFFFLWIFSDMVKKYKCLSVALFFKFSLICLTLTVVLPSFVLSIILCNNYEFLTIFFHNVVCFFGLYWASQLKWFWYDVMVYTSS